MKERKYKYLVQAKVTKARLKELIEEKITWDERVDQEIN